MFKKIVIALIYVFVLTVHSQSNVQIKNKIRNYPNISNSKELFNRINQDFKSDLNKVKALYAWITLNIKYQVSNSKLIKEPQQIVYFNEEDLENKIKAKNDKLVEKAIKNKAGVCEHMALTLSKICGYFSIENELIKGYVRNTPEEIGVKPKFKNHIWNAVKLDKRWVLIDATFGVDYDSKLDRPESNFIYFDIPKEQLRLTHYPSKNKWINFLNQTNINSFSSLPMFWDSFIKTKAELVSPKNGKFNNEVKKKYITFKNLNENLKITYKFDDDSFTIIPKIRRSKNYTNVIINSNRKGILTLYFDDRSALAFKIED